MKQHLDMYSKFKNLECKLIIKKKKDSTKRELFIPNKTYQRVLINLNNSIKKFKVSRYCYAYEKNCSIKRHALAHRNNFYFLHVDIKNFFSSITKEHILNTFGTNLNDFQKETLISLVTKNSILPTGFNTSPFISNRIMLKVDQKLSKVGFLLTYTRYADDLYFSSKKPIKKFVLNEIEKILKEYGFRINEKKTYFMHKRVSVTGILINNRKLSVGTSYKKNLKSCVYNYLVNGIGYVDIIKGKLSYLKSIEPKYYQVIKNKYMRFDENKVFFK